MKKLRITIGNKSWDVTVEDLSDTDPWAARTAPVPPAVSAAAHTAPATTAPVTTAPKVVSQGDPGAVTSPMAGLIRSILVKPADAVKQGQALVVLEAMKMENQITAPVGGTVKHIAVAANDQVNEGQVLLVLE